MRDLVCVFPDTNAFLHYPPMRDIDWCDLTDAKHVRLVICLTVIHELDTKKSDPRLAERAERAIREIRDARRPGIEVRPNVTLVVFNKEIRASEFPHTLSPDSADDRIVHLAKLYQSENAGTNVTVATGDYGMELRAEANGVEVIPLESSLRLPNPQDEQSRKLKQTQQELAALKNRLPSLALGLSHPDGTMALPHEITFFLEGEYQPINIQQEIAKIRADHPKHSGRRSRSSAGFNPADMIQLQSSIWEEGWTEYDKKLDKFYEEYRKHLELVEIVEYAKARSFTFDIWLENSGNGLATDIDVNMVFPEVIRFVGKKGTKECEPLEKVIEPPKPPEKPQPFAGISDFRSSFAARMPEFLSDLHDTPVFRRDEWIPYASVIRQADQYNEIRVRLGKLKHGDRISLGTFIAVFGSADLIGPFAADSTISTSDLRDRIVVKISFIAQRKDQPKE